MSNTIKSWSSSYTFRSHSITKLYPGRIWIWPGPIAVVPGRKLVLQTSNLPLFYTLYAHQAAKKASWNTADRYLFDHSRLIPVTSKMEARQTFTSATRTLSATNLRERLSSLSSLTTSPLKPPTLPKIHANIEYVFSFFVLSMHSIALYPSSWNVPIVLDEMIDG